MDFRVDALGEGVGDSMMKVVNQSIERFIERPRDGDHVGDATVRGPVVPAGKIAFRPARVQRQLFFNIDDN